jgi:hypothetical protein
LATLAVDSKTVLIQKKRVDWDTHTIGIPAHTTKDKENRRIRFDPNGRLAAVLARRDGVSHLCHTGIEKETAGFRSTRQRPPLVSFLVR